MVMHERKEKNSAIETILYEIDMLRHCHRTLSSKHALAEKTGSESDRAEYYLCIEGFLLHLRNLLAFFTGRRREGSDLILHDSEQWLGSELNPKAYSDLAKAAKDFDRRHGKRDRLLHDLISKYLQHCTTFRHLTPQAWDITALAQQMDDIAKEFESRFAKQTPSSGTRTTESHSTATVRTISPLGE
jgi:hypothetical protein